MGGGSGIESRLDDCIVRVRYRNANDEQFGEVPVSVREARLTITPGIRRRGGYCDVQWWENGDYKYHYQEDGLQFRFGREQDDAATDRPVNHFHPPNAPSHHRASTISAVYGPELVTLAVVANWYEAASRNDPDRLNTIPNPP